jgi:hypothetical protein
MNMHRRTLLRGLGAIIAAPAIVRASSLMPVKPIYGAPWTQVAPETILSDIDRMFALLLRQSNEHFLTAFYPVEAADIWGAQSRRQAPSLSARRLYFLGPAYDRPSRGV